MDHPRKRQTPASTLETTDHHLIKYVYDGVGQEILAYLQYTINRTLPAGFFQRSVVFHFRERLDRHVSLNEVEGKIEIIWNYCHSRNGGGRDWREVLARGTDTLPRLGRERIAWIQVRSYELEEIIDSEKAPRMLRSALRSPTPSRAGPKRKPVILRTPQRRKFKSESASPAPKKQSFYIKVPLSISRQGQPKKKHDSFGSDTNAVQNERAEGRSELSTSKDQCSSSIAASLNVAQLQLELKAAYSRIAQLDIEVDDLRLQEAETNQRWKMSCSKYDGLHRENKELQAKTTAKNRQGIMDQNADLRRENDSIRGQRDMLRRCVRFAPGDWKRSDLHEGQELEVDREVHDLTSKLKTFMPGLDSILLIPENLDVDLSLLEPLARAVLGAETDPLGDDSMRFLRLSKFRSRVILISLVSAALCTWVFDTDVEHIFTNNGLAHEKLIRLLNSAGDESLERMKFAVHKLCIDDANMENVKIPQRARYYSKRFFYTIKPLLEAQDFHESGAAQDTLSWADETAHLTEIFEAALWIKARLLLTTHFYHWAFPEPGIKFNRESMDLWIDEATPQQSEGTEQEVAITVFPALFQYRVNSRTFSYNRSVSKETAPAACKPLQRSRAIVVTR